MKHKIIRWLSCVMALLTLTASLCVPAFALEWDGSSSGGGGAGHAADVRGFAIRTTGDNVLGYRFSVVDKNGNRKGSGAIDVFRNTTYGNYEYSGAYKFNSKYNKVQLIANQNYGFSTSKTTSNCYKEADMGFASALPVASGMSSWQNDGRNLNPVLLKLGINKIAALKNGDKVLVEPLYDVMLEKTYHALTVTELALYGKYLLGASSDGGSSGTAASWGFISAYTNKHYPNELFTPDGQGLWTGVSALSKRATFYDIINKGYGVGIAYTETKSDFSPTLSVRCVEAWPGNKGNRQNHYGISYGSAFANYAYGNGYPVMGDKVWFAVNFPAESENCYVRQSVWVDGGGSTSRNVWSNSNTWYDVSLSPNTVDAGRSCYVVKARVDWIDSNGNVLKWGAAKSFYIPIKPKINRYQVSMYDIMGSNVAYGGSGGYSGSVYVGQRAYAKYTYTSSNTWWSYNDLWASMHKWSPSAGWVRTKGANTTDGTSYNTALKSGSNANVTSSLGYVRVPDNSANTNGGNRMPFLLTTQWHTDGAHTLESTWIDIPIIKADVELLDIRLIDESGNYITGRNVWENQLVTPQYVYRNNTGCTVYVEGYNDDGTKISGIYSIPANGQIAVNGKQLRVGHSSTFSVWGGVYLEGAGRLNTNWEKTDFNSQNNNHWSRYWYVQNPLTIEAVTPNSYYREGVQVMTSFRVYNASPTAFIPSDNVYVTFTVTKGSTVYSSQSKATVIPGSSDNLVYFKWTVPKNLGGAALNITGSVKYNGSVKDTDSLSVVPVVITNSQTPDTKYEDKKPSGWSASAVPSSYANTAYWSEWTYQNGSFVRSNYGMSVSASGLSILPDPDSPSAEKVNGVWNMKSGYGYSFSWRPYTVIPTGRSTPSSAMYTAIQTGYAILPEFNYSLSYGKYRSLQSSSGAFFFAENAAADYDRLSFIPVWYPNGTQNYIVTAYVYDCWTPAGMIGARASSNGVSIVGSLYDDYYVGR